jgi:hypothetical protein
MNKYIFHINKNIKKKYKESTNHNPSFLKDFIFHRAEIMKFIVKTDFPGEKIKDNDTTYKLLRRVFNLKKKSNNKIALAFYKKFENNLRLKIQYDKKLHKIKNEETSLSTYIYLGLIICHLKFLDHFQKINCILKILDRLVKNKNHLILCNKTLLLKLLKKEEKIFKLIQNEK